MWVGYMRGADLNCVTETPAPMHERTPFAGLLGPMPDQTWKPSRVERNAFYGTSFPEAHMPTAENGEGDQYDETNHPEHHEPSRLGAVLLVRGADASAACDGATRSKWTTVSTPLAATGRPSRVALIFRAFLSR